MHFAKNTLFQTIAWCVKKFLVTLPTILDSPYGEHGGTYDTKQYHY
jgi:hypothetical protein